MQQVDRYKDFDLSKINEHKYSHIKLLWGWVFYFIAFYLTENFIPVEKCHVIHCPLDDIIPFNEYFVIFYCLFYVMVFGSLLYFFFYDERSFKKLQTYLIVTQVIAIFIYIIYPSVQIGRPSQLDDTFLCNVIGYIYSIDTPTGVCPSLHVAYSLGLASIWRKKKKTSIAVKILMIIITTLIAISVVFVKQHSVIDIIAAIPLCLLAEYITYNRYHKAEIKLLKKKLNTKPNKDI